MQLGDLLSQERIRVPLRAESLADAVTQLLQLADPDRGEPGDGPGLLARLRSGEGGSVHRPTPDILILVLRAGEGDESRGAMGVSPEALAPSDEASGDEDPRGPRVVILLRVTRSVPLGEGVMGRITGVLRDPEVSGELLNAETPLDVRSLRPLMAVELKERLKVEHVMVPLSYRVFPHTPLDEVVDLMSRKGLRALPVVGDDLQVLGIVTAGEALRYAVQKKSRGEAGKERTKEVGGTARDVMIRSVMCVSEDEDLRNAARTMVNKDMGQLPVVREGEIVGVLTRDAVLKALYGN
jgi:CBS domain-containing protein